MSEENLTPTLELDAEIPLSQLNMELVKDVEEMEPFGEGNPRPRFCSRGLTVKGAPLMMGRDTLKFWVTDGKAMFQAVGFGMAKFYDLVVHAKAVDIAYALAVDDWNKEPIVQLDLKDVREAG